MALTLVQKLMKDWKLMSSCFLKMFSLLSGNKKLSNIYMHLYSRKYQELSPNISTLLSSQKKWITLVTIVLEWLFSVFSKIFNFLYFSKNVREHVPVKDHTSHHTYIPFKKGTDKKCCGLVIPCEYPLEVKTGNWI